MQELAEVEFGFQLEDLFALLKRGLRSIRNLTYALEQLQNFIDFWGAMALIGAHPQVCPKSKKLSFLLKTQSGLKPLRPMPAR